MQTNTIETIDILHCPICKSTGEIVYANLSDILYLTQGYWNIRKCNNKLCKTLWVDPRASDSHLHLLYTNYSTHDTPAPQPPKQNQTIVKRVLNNMRSAILSTKLGYQSHNNRFHVWMYNLLSYSHLSWRDAQCANVFYTPFKKNGHLLDIGCGNGSSLLMLKQQGWERVEGIDFDEKAIHAARLAGLDASVSDLFSKKYPENHFDAIIMNHVIEHIPHIHNFLNECLRILKPGGTLRALTPNSNSFGSNFYKKDWRGLEVPRHLQIFTADSIKLAAHTAGFNDVKSFSTIQGGTYILSASHEIRKTNTCDAQCRMTRFQKIKRKILFFVLGPLYCLQTKKGEVIVLSCSKPF